MLTVEQIKAMTDQEVMVAFAEDAATIPEEDTETLLWIARMYRTLDQETADALITQELGVGRSLDPDLCRQMLIDFVEYNTGVKP